MALRSLMKGKELRTAQKSLEEARAKIEEMKTREAELETAIEEAETDEEKAAVEEALESVNHALLTSKEDLALDAVVQDLEEALNSLGEVTGEVTADDVLGSIFSRFCVGK